MEQLLNSINLIVRGVVIHEGHILLSTTTEANKEYDLNLYFLPGGHVDYKESALAALRREFLEEMDAHIDEDMLFIGALECCWNKKGSIYHELNLLYRVSMPELSLRHPPQSTDERIMFIWWPINKMADLPILPEKLGEMLQQYIQNKATGLFYTQV